MDMLLYETSRNALVLTAVTAGIVIVPLLVLSLAVGLFQAATQIQDSSLTAVPKIALTLFLAVALGPWLGQQILQFARLTFQLVAHVGR